MPVYWFIIISWIRIIFFPNFLTRYLINNQLKEQQHQLKPLDSKQLILLRPANIERTVWWVGGCSEWWSTRTVEARQAGGQCNNTPWEWVMFCRMVSSWNNARFQYELAQWWRRVEFIRMLCLGTRVANGSVRGGSCPHQPQPDRREQQDRHKDLNCSAIVTIRISITVRQEFRCCSTSTYTLIAGYSFSSSRVSGLV